MFFKQTAITIAAAILAHISVILGLLYSTGAEFTLTAIVPLKPLLGYILVIMGAIYSLGVFIYLLMIFIKALIVLFKDCKERKYVGHYTDI